MLTQLKFLLSYILKKGRSDALLKEPVTETFLCGDCFVTGGKQFHCLHDAFKTPLKCQPKSCSRICCPFYCSNILDKT